MGCDTPAEREFLTTRGLAEFLSVSRRTIEAWRRRGIGPPYSRIGAQARYRLDEVEAWVESCRVVPEPRKAAGE